MNTSPHELVALDLADQRNTTAADISGRTGLDLEQVYEVLVHMESQGAARILMVTHGQGKKALWGMVPVQVSPTSPVRSIADAFQDLPTPQRTEAASSAFDWRPQ